VCLFNIRYPYIKGGEAKIFLKLIAFHCLHYGFFMSLKNSLLKKNPYNEGTQKEIVLGTYEAEGEMRIILFLFRIAYDIKYGPPP
jgi:hypothetical protein